MTPDPVEPASHPARLVMPLMALVLTGVGLLSGRFSLILVAAPFLIAGLWATGRSRGIGAGLAFDPAGDRLSVDSPEGAEAVRVRLSCDGHRPLTALVPGRAQTLPMTLHWRRTGHKPTVRADWDLHGPFLLTHTAAARSLSRPLVVLPQALPIGPVPQSPRLRGLTGPVTSRRPGDGFELRDVHPLGPGDPVRRIDWRVTARQPGEDLWVRGTYASGEPVAVLILDSRDEVGPDVHTWRGTLPLRVDEPTSLDLARHAAATVARRLLDTGNRVGLVDLATGRRLLTPAAGRRQLDRLVYALALAEPVGSPRRQVRPPQVPADAIVYLFSTLLDDEPIHLARTLRNTGHPVLVIDTLPEVRPMAELNLEVAWRITSAERDRRIRELEARRLPVIRWAGPHRQAAGERLAALRRAQSSRVRGGRWA